jgi:hypothetical protein
LLAERSLLFAVISQAASAGHCRGIIVQPMPELRPASNSSRADSTTSLSSDLPFETEQLEQAAAAAEQCVDAWRRRFQPAAFIAMPGWPRLIEKALNLSLVFSLPLFWLQQCFTRFAMAFGKERRPEATIDRTELAARRDLPASVDWMDAASLGVRLAWPLPLLIALTMDVAARLGPDWRWPATLYIAVMIGSTLVAAPLLAALAWLRVRLLRQSH